MNRSIRNVFFITVDCLRSDILNEELRYLPVFSYLTNNGKFIKDCMANSVPTYLAFPMIFSSRVDLPSKLRYGYPKLIPNLVETLRSNSITTHAFTDGNAWLSRYFGYDLFFDIFEDDLNYQNSKKTVISSIWNKLKTVDSIDFLTRLFFTLFKGKLYPPSLEIIDRALKNINTLSDKKKFIWLHLMDLHYPWFSKSTSTKKQVKAWQAFSKYRPNRQIGNSKLKAISNIGKELYREKLRDVDKALEKLLNTLEKRKMLDSSVIIIASDHGTEFGENNGLGHGPWKTIEEYIRIPLVLFSGSGNVKSITPEYCEQIDIAPTILNFFGINIPSSWQGQSLLGKYSDKPRYCSFKYDFDPLRKDTFNNEYVIAVDYKNAKFILNKHLNIEKFESLDTFEHNEIKVELQMLAKKFLQRLRLKERLTKIVLPKS